MINYPQKEAREELERINFNYDKCLRKLINACPQQALAYYNTETHKLYETRLKYYPRNVLHKRVLRHETAQQLHGMYEFPGGTKIHIIELIINDLEEQGSLVLILERNPDYLSLYAIDSHHFVV